MEGVCKYFVNKIITSSFFAIFAAIGEGTKKVWLKTVKKCARISGNSERSNSEYDERDLLTGWENERRFFEQSFSGKEIYERYVSEAKDRQLDSDSNADLIPWSIRFMGNFADLLNTSKTASSIRTIALCDECFNQLILLRSRQRLDNKLIFPSPITGGLRDPSSVTRKLHRMQKRAGVPQIRFHDLRHSFATLSLEQGMDIKTISHMLGHTDAGFTMNTYMHVTNNMQQTVADAIGNLITESENERKNKFIHFSA